jgi:hypothetical protein
VEHEHVAVGIGEVGHVADAPVERLAREGHASGLQRLPSLLDVRDAQRDRRRVRTDEFLPDVRRVDEVEADVLAQLELGPPPMADLLEAEGVPEEGGRPLEVR